MKISLGRICLIGISLFQFKASAAPLHLVAGIGKPFFFVNSETQTGLDVKDALSTNIDIIKPLEKMPFAIGVFYQGILFSPTLGDFPLNQSGLALYFFPFGIANQTFSYDGEVEVRQTRLSTFLKLAGGLSFFNFRNNTLELQFGSSAFNYQLAGGMDLPISSTISAGLEIGYFATFGGSSYSLIEGEAPPSAGVYGFNFVGRLGYVWN